MQNITEYINFTHVTLLNLRALNQCGKTNAIQNFAFKYFQA